MITHYLNGRQYQLPSTWNELSREQLLRAVHVLFKPATEPELQARLIPVLLELYRWHTPGRTWRFIKMPLLEVDEFRAHTNFLLQGQAQLTKQLLPTIRPLLRTWYGPGDYLNGLTFAEWIEAESALFYYHLTKKEDFLNRLVAVLYRPGQTRKPNPVTGDRRPPYVQHEVAARAKLAGRLSMATRQAVLIYYDSCRQVIINNYPEAFSAGDDDEQTQRAPASPAPAYLRILRELAGSPDKFEVMGQQPAGNIFFDLAERVKQAEALAKAREKHD